MISDCKYRYFYINCQISHKNIDISIFIPDFPPPPDAGLSVQVFSSVEVELETNKYESNFVQGTVFSAEKKLKSLMLSIFLYFCH